MPVDCNEITRSIAALTSGEANLVALVASFVCELHYADDRFN